MKAIFLTQTPKNGAAARYRVYQYIDYLEKEGIQCFVSPACSEKVINNLTLRGNIFDKFLAYLQPFYRRSKDLFRVRNFDVVFIQREVLIHFPGVFEWIISKMNNKIVFDFDDALYTYPQGGRYAFLYRLRGRNKIPYIIKTAKFVIAGNRYLKEYALQFNEKTAVIPTSINTDSYNQRKKLQMNKIPIIGWIGRPGSSVYVKQFKNVFKKLAAGHNFILKVIGGKDMQIEGVKIVNKEWKLEEEINDIYTFDIGIMPLSDSEWTRGKSATKILQCMAAGVPVVCSAVGANCDIIRDGVNGFLAKTQEEWLEKLSLLLRDGPLRQRLGEEGRSLVEKSYSLKANSSKLKEILVKVGSNN